ncbi:MAG: HEPN domain-containing protein [Limisphaerales bacterium]
MERLLSDTGDWQSGVNRLVIYVVARDEGNVCRDRHRDWRAGIACYGDGIGIGRIPSDAYRSSVKAILEAAPAEHRAWLKEKLHFANQKTLAERINDILNLHSSEATQLASKIKDFAVKVRHTRNYYTHYMQETWESGKVAKGLELRRIAYALYFLLQICLLKELRIEGEPIKRILERSSSMKWEDLGN